MYTLLLFCSAGDEPINSRHLQLIEWTNKKGSTSCLRLYEEMAPHWKVVANLIGLKKEIIAVNHRDDALECIRGVMKEWMINAPNITTYSCTWNGLCNLLDNAQLGKAREDLQEACSLQH